MLLMQTEQPEGTHDLVGVRRHPPRAPAFSGEVDAAKQTVIATVVRPLRHVRVPGMGSVRDATGGGLDAQHLTLYRHGSQARPDLCPRRLCLCTWHEGAMIMRLG